MLGRLDFNGTTWAIEDLKPHVSLRFKKMFGGIQAAQRPPFFLRDTPDRAADLDWFMQRYPLEMSPRAAEALADGLAAYRHRRVRIEDLKKPGYAPSLLPAFKAPERPHDYQVRAAELWRSTGRLLLMDDVGLGKTVTALAGISDRHGLPAAVVVQPHLSSQWVTQYINRFTHLSAIEIKDRNVRTLDPADVYVFRYSNIGHWSDYAETLGCRSVILDEVQELRHGSHTNKGMGVKAFVEVADFVIGLTATPIYNYGDEIFNVVEFICPGALGGEWEFKVNWCHASGSHWVVTDPSALGAFLVDEGIAVRRTCADEEVSITLPPLSKVITEVDWNEGDAQTDRELQEALAQRILTGSFHERGSAARELDLLLRQETGIAKARAVAAYARTLAEAGEAVVLAGWHREVYRIWNEALADLNPVMFTGTESQAAKKRARDTFCQGGSNIMIMSLRSGAGLDGLQTRAAHVVFGELDWSPQVHVQVTGRLHRQGQTKPVTAHYLHVDGGSDPVIMSMLGLKASQSHGILNPFGGADQAIPINETRMKQLARAVLGQKEEVDG